MDIPVSVGDQEAYHIAINESINLLQSVAYILSKSYNELEPQQGVDITNLGSAAEAILFAVERLKEQKIELESYRKELRKEITSTYEAE